MKKIFFVLLLFLVKAPAMAEEIQAIAKVDQRDGIYVGEDFIYQIVIDGDDKAATVDLAPLQDFNPRSAGTQNLTRLFTNIVNGRKTERKVERFVMNYRLSVIRPGSVTLPPVTVQIDGKTYKTNHVRINVQEPETTDEIALEVKLNEDRCYVGQPVTMLVNFYVFANVDSFRFDIPVFSDKNFYVENLQSTMTGQQYQLHDGTTVFVTKERIYRDGRQGVLLSFKKAVIPRISGDMVLASAKVHAKIAVKGKNSNRDIFDSFFDRNIEYKRVLAKSEPLKLTVDPLPAESKPKDFYGLVGKYTITAEAQPTEVSVGDPITLKIKVSGSDFLKPVQWPDLANISGMENFKIPDEKSSPEIEAGSKVFTQTIRAKNDQLQQIPPIPLAYFDVDKGSYVVAKSEPIQLNVKSTKLLTANDMFGSSGQEFKNSQVEAVNKGISANFEKLSALTDQQFELIPALIRPAYMSLWAGPLGIFALSLAARLMIVTSPEKKQHKKKKQALAKTISKLKKASRARDNEKLPRIDDALKTYIADRFTANSKALTALDCFQILNEYSTPELARQIQDIIEICEAAQFGHTDIDLVDTKKIAQLLRKVERQAKK